MLLVETTAIMLSLVSKQHEVLSSFILPQHILISYWMEQNIIGESRYTLFVSICLHAVNKDMCGLISTKDSSYIERCPLLTRPFENLTLPLMRMHD